MTVVPFTSAYQHFCLLGRMLAEMKGCPWAKDPEIKLAISEGGDRLTVELPFLGDPMTIALKKSKTTTDLRITFVDQSTADQDTVEEILFYHDDDSRVGRVEFFRKLKKDGILSKPAAWGLPYQVINTIVREIGRVGYETLRPASAA